MRRYKKYSKKDARKIVKYQNLLTMLKYTVRKQRRSFDDIDEIKILKDEILAIKQI